MPGYCNTSYIYNLTERQKISSITCIMSLRNSKLSSKNEGLFFVSFGGVFCAGVWFVWLVLLCFGFFLMVWNSYILLQENQKNQK